MRVRKLLLLEPTAATQQLSHAIQSDDWEVQVTHTVTEAKSLAAEEIYHVGIVLLENLDCFSVYDLERLTMKHPVEWLAVVAPECLQNPAFTKLVIENFYDHHTLPLDTERLMFTLGHAYGRAQMKHNLNKSPEWVGRYQMVGRSPPMLALYSKLDRITKVDAPVLIIGESGTGKELVARAIHENSWRADGPFVPVNCGGLAENLIHSELFGHEKGAFTGAYQRKIGSLETAAGGVIFLDEVGDLPLSLQANLLRFLQEKTIVRLGSNEPSISMFASLPRPTSICKGPSPKAASARIYTIASTCCILICLPCAIGQATWKYSRERCSRNFIRKKIRWYEALAKKPCVR